jgi:hypothetical protein
MADALPRAARRIADVRDVFRHLERFHGITPDLASGRLHEIKKHLGYPPDADLIFTLSGDIYDPATLEWLGSMTAGGGKR